MLTIIDNSDVLFHYHQLKAAGIVPPQAKLDGVTFERGGSVLVDGAIDLPVIGGFDVKFKVAVKLLSDHKTIRLRVIDVNVSGIGTRGIVLKVLERIVQGLTVPGLRWVVDGDDGYAEYVRPQNWILMKDIQTDGDKLSIVLLGFDIPLAMKEFQAAQIDALRASPSMAAQVQANRLAGGIKTSVKS